MIFDNTYVKIDLDAIARNFSAVQEKTGVPIPGNLCGLQEKKELHTGVIPKDTMLDFVMGL